MNFILFLFYNGYKFGRMRERVTQIDKHTETDRQGREMERGRKAKRG